MCRQAMHIKESGFTNLGPGEPPVVRKCLDAGLDATVTTLGCLDIDCKTLCLIWAEYSVREQEISKAGPMDTGLQCPPRCVAPTCHDALAKSSRCSNSCRLFAAMSSMLQTPCCPCVAAQYGFAMASASGRSQRDRPQWRRHSRFKSPILLNSGLLSN
jgi:hypothetical protein